MGSTARVAIATLLGRGRRVRAMVRQLDERSDILRDLGAEVVVADLLDIVALRTAMQGCSAVYFTMSISPIGTACRRHGDCYFEPYRSKGKLNMRRSKAGR